MVPIYRLTRAVDRGTINSGGLMFLAVTCKNPKHYEENPWAGHRIKVAERHASGKVQVKCDSCGKAHWYEPQDVLNFA
jgi:hypothetical protein